MQWYTWSLHKVEAYELLEMSAGPVICVASLACETWEHDCCMPFGSIGFVYVWQIQSPICIRYGVLHQHIYIYYYVSNAPLSRPVRSLDYA
jgi:hypothetical protein